MRREFDFLRTAPARQVFGFSLSVAAATGGLALVFLAAGLAHTESVLANGATRTLRLTHIHTHESVAATYMVDGRYDPAVLHRLDHFLRDWRNNDEIHMDPRLFDVIWEIYRESGSRQPIEVVSAYRSPATNAMLRRHTSGVALHSQHMLGKAMDIHFTDEPMSKIRKIAMRLEDGGVGYYPRSGIPFVHVDVGNIRYWPRMSYAALSRLFPDGKAVFLAADGRRLSHYAEARAEIAARGKKAVERVAAARPRSFWAMLFGGGDQQSRGAALPSRRRAEAVRPRRVVDTVATALPRPVPRPPHRPIELASLTGDSAHVPLPPPRPVLDPSGITPPRRTAEAPARITGDSGSFATSSPGGATLAYAASMIDPTPTGAIRPAHQPRSPRPSASAPTLGVRPAMPRKPVEFAAARLDPMRFRALLAPIPLARATGASALGALVGALRSAARVGFVELVFGPPSALAVRFGRVATDLSTGTFSGPAVRPLALRFRPFDRAPGDTTPGHRFD